MNPPPPIPHDCGRATFSANTVATAASMALPPDSSTLRPIRAAAGDSVATTPSRPVTPAWNRDPSRACAVGRAARSRTSRTSRTENSRDMTVSLPKARDLCLTSGVIGHGGFDRHALRHLPVLSPARLQRGALVDARGLRPLRHSARAGRAASAARHGPGERLDEVLELAGRPALERLAVALVGGDH